MSELCIPENWAEIECQHLFKITKGKNPKLNQIQNDEMLPYLSVKYLRGTEQASFASIHDKNSIIINTEDIILIFDGSKSGECFSGYNGILSSTMAKLEFDQFIFPRFVDLFMKSNFELFNGAKAGAAIPHFDKNTFCKLNFPIPPRGEQERIVQKIDTCFQKINETEKALNEVEVLLTKYRESLLAKAFRGELIPLDPKNEPASKLLEKISAERAKNSNGKKVQEFAPILDDEKPFDLPAGWEWVRLGTLIKDGPSNGLYKNVQFYGEGVPIVRIDSFYDGYLIPFENLKRLKVSKDELNRYKIEKNDFVLNRVNSIQYLGKSVLVRDIPEPMVYESNMMRFSTFANYVNNEFLLIYLNSSFGLSELRKNAKQAINQASINQTDVNSILIPLPPLIVQGEIARKILHLNQKMLKSEAFIKSLRELSAKTRESVLNKAFQGSLVHRLSIEGTGHELLAKILENKKECVEGPKKKVPTKTGKKTIAKMVKK